MKACPLCEGLGQLPDEAVEGLLRAAASKHGFRLQRKPTEPATPTRDYSRIYQALGEARESLGFGPPRPSGKPDILRRLADHSDEDWIVAIRSQRDSLRSSLARGKITRDEASSYLSILTIHRTFSQCLERVAQNPTRIVRLSDGTIAEESAGVRRVLSPEEVRSRGLDQT